MPRSDPITYDEVAEAAERLEAEGKKASSRMVRKTLGNRGSATTIVRHLATFKRRRDALALGPDAKRPPLPDTLERGLRAGVETLWNEIIREGDAWIEELERHASEQISKAEAQTAQTRSAYETLDAKHTRTVDALHETGSDLDTLRATHATLVIERQRLETALAAERTRGEGLVALAEERKVQIDAGVRTLAATRADLESTLREERERAEETHTALRADAAENQSLLREQAKLREATLSNAITALERQIDIDATTEQKRQSALDEALRSLVDERQKLLDAITRSTSLEARARHLETQLAASETRATKLEDSLAEERVDMRTLRATLDTTLRRLTPPPEPPPDGPQ